LIGLRAEGLIVSGTFNEVGYDRTKWYCPSDQFHLSETANGIAKNGEPIPVGKPDINQMINSQHDDIMFGLSQQMASLTAREAQYIPHPATWLNQERWNDDAEQPHNGRANGTHGRADRPGLEWLKHSLPSLNDCPDTRKKAIAAVTALSEPAHPAKVMARVLALLNPYFDKDTPQAIREIEAEDWAAALVGQPYWAIEKAARWWRSDENPDRRKRPLEGDLVARTKREMDAVSAAKIKLMTAMSFGPPCSTAQKRRRRSC
jgi:hypothetical protein